MAGSNPELCPVQPELAVLSRSCPGRSPAFSECKEKRRVKSESDAKTFKLQQIKKIEKPSRCSKYRKEVYFSFI
jgi:hypothetical protein